MKNFKYVALVALLLSSMLAGCNASWNPFRKKPVVADPPLAAVTTLDNTGAGAEAIRPDTSTGTGTGTGTDLTAGTDTTGTAADTTPPPPVAGETTYTIKKKDTLWSIAAKYLGNGQRYREILATNPGLDAKKLAVGQTIKLPPK
ncbi:MAG: LysM domain-containing protein [Phycisphaerae bacterium]|jgi:nucleoid-associated protein YgaU|nr:LysM domain-containing protein [Phycisphaerae bacterium]